MGRINHRRYIVDILAYKLQVLTDILRIFRAFQNDTEHISRNWHFCYMLLCIGKEFVYRLIFLLFYTGEVHCGFAAAGKSDIVELYFIKSFCYSLFCYADGIIPVFFFIWVQPCDTVFVLPHSAVYMFDGQIRPLH